MRKSETCDDIESTMGFRPVAVLFGAYDGWVTLYSSGLTFSLLRELL